MTKGVSIVELLAADSKRGERCRINGWVRTRRDSKAGLSFVAVHDGSCFDALQVVAPATLSNYQNEVLKLSGRLCRRGRGHPGGQRGQGAGRRVASRLACGTGLG